MQSHWSKDILETAKSNQNTRPVKTVHCDADLTLILYGFNALVFETMLLEALF